MAKLDWLWSYSLNSAVRELSLAREAELLLVRLDDQSIALLTTNGELQARQRLPDLSSLTISDDGSAIVAVASSGLIRWLAPDLSTRQEQKVSGTAVTVATDSFGRYVAVSDRQSNIHVLDKLGQALGHVQCPRPIQHLAFMPSSPFLVAAADWGWVGCLDLGIGQWAWSDRPVTNIGSIAVGGCDDSVLLACYSEGLRHYERGGSNRAIWTTSMPCRFVASSFSGDVAIAGGASPRLVAFDRTGRPLHEYELTAPPAFLELAARGDRFYVGDADGSLTAMRIEIAAP